MIFNKITLYNTKDIHSDVSHRAVVSPPQSVGSTRSLFDSPPDCLTTIAPPGFESLLLFMKIKTAPIRCCFDFGEPVGIRTLDTRLRRPLLYPAELRAHAYKKWSGRRDSNSRPSPWQGDALPLSHFRIFNWSREMDSNHRKLS